MGKGAGLRPGPWQPTTITNRTTGLHRITPPAIGINTGGSDGCTTAAPHLWNQNAAGRGKKLQYRHTEFCPWVQKGTCMMGSTCNYAHSQAELRNKPDLSRTKLCTLAERGLECNNPNCKYAHNITELRATEQFYKIQLCKFWNRGACTSGTKCRHAHGPAELRDPVVNLVSPPVNGDPQHTSRGSSEEAAGCRPPPVTRSTKKVYNKQVTLPTRGMCNGTTFNPSQGQRRSPPVCDNLSGAYNNGSPPVCSPSIVSMSSKRPTGTDGVQTHSGSRLQLRRSTNPNQFDNCYERRASTVSVSAASISNSPDTYYSPLNEWHTVANNASISGFVLESLNDRVCSQRYAPGTDNRDCSFNERSMIGAIANNDFTTCHQQQSSTPRSTAPSDISSGLQPSRMICSLDDRGYCPSPEGCYIEPSPNTSWAAIDPPHGGYLLQPVAMPEAFSFGRCTPAEQFEGRSSRNGAATIQHPKQTDWDWNCTADDNGCSAGSLSTSSGSQTNTFLSSTNSSSKTECLSSPEHPYNNTRLLGPHPNTLRFDSLIDICTRTGHDHFDPFGSVFLSSTNSSGDEGAQGGLMSTARSTGSSVNSKGSALSSTQHPTAAGGPDAVSGVAQGFSGHDTTSKFSLSTADNTAARGTPVCPQRNTHPQYLPFQEGAFVLPPVDAPVHIGTELPPCAELNACAVLRDLNMGEDSPAGFNEQYEHMYRDRKVDEVCLLLLCAFLRGLKVDNTVPDSNLTDAVEACLHLNTAGGGPTYQEDGTPPTNSSIDCQSYRRRQLPTDIAVEDELGGALAASTADTAAVGEVLRSLGFNLC